MDALPPKCPSEAIIKVENKLFPWFLWDQNRGVTVGRVFFLPGTYIGWSKTPCIPKV